MPESIRNDNIFNYFSVTQIGLINEDGGDSQSFTIQEDFTIVDYQTYILARRIQDEETLKVSVIVERNDESR